MIKREDRSRKGDSARARYLRAKDELLTFKTFEFIEFRKRMMKGTGIEPEFNRLSS